MFSTKEGSTGRLIQLCIGYFVFYVITGVTVKYFLGKAAQGYPGMLGPEFLVYSTLGGTTICLGVVLALGWWRMEPARRVTALQIPVEWLYIIPSGICTAVVIPTTTLMYTLPITVMVAMVLMRGAVIVISRIVDTIQQVQGILHKKVYWQENVAVVLALGAVGINVLWKGGKGGFDFLASTAAVTIFSSYIVAYAIRIYIMNYYKNTAGKTVKRDNKAFFAIEQIAASSTLALATVFVFFSPALVGKVGRELDALQQQPQQLAAQIVRQRRAALDQSKPLAQKKAPRPSPDGKTYVCPRDWTAMVRVENDHHLVGYICPREQIVWPVAGSLAGGAPAFHKYVNLLAFPYWPIHHFNRSITERRPLWIWAVVAGMAFGVVAFFSVFIFMFKGRTATFAGVVNRLTSLVAGTTATLIMWHFWNGPWPSAEKWVALGLIVAATGFLTSAERRRVVELVATKELQA